MDGRSVFDVLLSTWTLKRKFDTGNKFSFSPHRVKETLFRPASLGAASVFTPSIFSYAFQWHLKPYMKLLLFSYTRKLELWGERTWLLTQNPLKQQRSLFSGTVHTANPGFFTLVTIIRKWWHYWLGCVHKLSGPWELLVGTRKNNFLKVLFTSWVIIPKFQCGRRKLHHFRVKVKSRNLYVQMTKITMQTTRMWHSSIEAPHYLHVCQKQDEEWR